MYARTDHIKYETGLRTLRNMLCMRHGGATMRPGTMYVATTQNSGQQVRLIPFIFNETGTGQSYVLEFGNGYVAFYQNGGVVLNGGVPYVIASQYLQADLQDLNFSQSNDVLTIVHRNYPPTELRRLAATSWSFTAVTFDGTAVQPNLTFAGGDVGFADYIVTAVMPNGDETAVYNFYANATKPTSTMPVTITIAYFGAGTPAYYRVYKYDITVTPAVGSVAGFIGTTNGNTFIDNGIVPDYANNPPIPGPLKTAVAAGDYPTVVGYVQQRRAFAATTANPVGVWESVPGSPNNFTTHVPPVDDDAIFFSIAGEEVNEVQAVLELKFMLLMTAGAELFVQGNGSGVVTPSAINAATQSQYGCSNLRPLKVGDVLLFNQALGSFIRDFSFDFSIDGYRGNDITIFSSHLFEGYSVSDWAYQKIPDSIIWAVRSDGVLLSCTYVREQQVLAWARHDFTNGIVENICAIPENGEYAVYLSIKRVIDGATVRYIERISSRIWSDPLDATYLDCFATYDGRNTTSTTMRLTGSFSAPAGSEYEEELTLIASAGFFTTDMVGNQIFLQDALFVSSQGKKGNQIRCTIQEYTSSIRVNVTPNRAVPAEFQNIATDNWSLAVDEVSGLDYLIGQEVSVWADRFVVGSPLNSNVSSVYTVSASGTVTLDHCYAVIYVGLPMIADLEPMDLETSFGGTILAKRKRNGKLNVYVYNSRSLFAGSQNPDNNVDNTDDDLLYGLIEQMGEANRQTYDEPPSMKTGQDYVTFDTRWNYGGRIFIRNVDPIPLTILAVAAEGEDPASSPFYKKGQ